MLKAVEYMLYISCGLCLTLNLFLLYIVKRFTSRSMKPFSNLIIQTIVVDMAASVFMTLFQLVSEVNNGIVFHGSGNPWLPWPGQWRCAPITVFAIVNNVSFWSVPIHAMYRYIIIVRKRQISQWFPLIIFFFVALFISGVTFPAAVFATTNSTSLDRLQSMGFWKGEDTGVLCTLEVLSWPVFTYLLGELILGNIGISSLMWFTKRLNYTLYSAQMHFSSKTKQAHKEISRKLYIQAAIPSVMNVFLVGICVCVFFVPDYYGGLLVALLLPYPWIVVINPVHSAHFGGHFGIVCHCNRGFPQFSFFKKIFYLVNLEPFCTYLRFPFLLKLPDDIAAKTEMR